MEHFNGKGVVMDKAISFLHNFGAIWFLALVGVLVALMPATIFSLLGVFPHSNLFWLVSAMLGGSAIGLLLRRN